MFAYRARGFAALIGATQCVLHWLAMFLAVLLPWVGLVQALSVRFGPLCWAWAAGIGAEALWRSGRGVFGISPEWGTCWKRALFTAAFSGATVFDPVVRQMSLILAVWVWAAHVLLLVGTHWALPRLFARVLFYDQHRHRVVVVGAASKVADLGRVLRSKQELGFHPVGWMGLGEEFVGDAGLPFFGGAHELEQVVRQESVDQVILAGGLRDAQVSRWKSDCERLGVRLVVAQNFAEVDAWQFSWEAQGEWCFGVACREPLQSPFNRVLKRLLDMAVAVPAVLFVVLPVALVTILAQRKQSPGPLFYRQLRHGRGNRPFQVWKFRTMHSDPALVAVQAQQAMREDPRVFPYASWLRRHSLDELPQFLNVLLGEMSVVGPRPHFVDHTGQFAEQERYHLRSFVKPGITGLAQVNGCRGEVRRPEDMERRVKFDIAYVEQWNLLLDVRLIFSTAWQVVVPPETAY